MTDNTSFGPKIYISEYIKFLERQINNLTSATGNHPDAYYFTEIPVIKVTNTAQKWSESELLNRDDFEAEAEFIWEEE